MKGLLDTKRNTIGDIVADDKVFEVHKDFRWVDIPVELANTDSALIYENNKVVVSHRFIEGGSPKLEKEIRLSQATVEYNGYRFSATEKAQEALSRNVMLLDEGETIEWVEKNKIHEFTPAEAKELLKLMTKETLSIIKELKLRELELYKKGFTELDLDVNIIPEELPHINLV